MQTLFLQGPSVTLRTLALVIASVGLIVLDHRGSQMEIVRNGLSYVLYPLQYTIDLPIRLYYWSDETLSTHKTLLHEKRRLEDFQLLNKVRLQKLDILEKENKRLRKLLSATPKLTEKILIASMHRVSSVRPFTSVQDHLPSC